MQLLSHTQISLNKLRFKEILQLQNGYELICPMPLRCIEVAYLDCFTLLVGFLLPWVTFMIKCIIANRDCPTKIEDVGRLGVNCGGKVSSNVGG